MSLSRALETLNMIEEITVEAEKMVKRLDNLEAENKRLNDLNEQYKHEIALLTEIVRNLSKPAPAPAVPNLPTFPTFPQPNTQWYGNCPTCGLKLDSVMGYVCPNGDCPTGLGGSKC